MLNAKEVSMLKLYYILNFSDVKIKIALDQVLLSALYFKSFWDPHMNSPRVPKQISRVLNFEIFYPISKSSINMIKIVLMYSDKIISQNIS